MNFYKYGFFLFGFLVLQIIETNTSPVKPCDGLDKDFQKLIERAVALIRDSNKILKEKIQTLPKQIALNIFNAIKTAAECETANLIAFLKGNRTLEEHDIYMIMCFLQVTTTIKDDLKKLNLTRNECLQPNTTVKPPEVKEPTTNQTIKNDQTPTNKTVPHVQDNEKEPQKNKTKSVRDVSLYQNISTKDDPAKPEGTAEHVQEGADKNIPADANRAAKKWST